MFCRSRFAVVAATLSLTACAVTTADVNGPVRLALTEPVESLETRAASGAGDAQYAMSFLLRVGARGVAEDQVRSEQLRALAARPSTMMITQYIPGIDGAPGRTAMIPVTTPGIQDAEARRMDMCGLSLLARMPALGASVCGSSQAYIDLIPAAAAALLEGGPMTRIAPPPVDPATVSDCAATPALWRQASDRFDARDYQAARAAADRIISLCGDSEPSWHARVMRALIALSENQVDGALALLAPVPRPAPAPIGGYSSFVAIMAHALRDDWASYAAERDAVLAASVAALSRDGSARTFTAQGVTMSMFERRVPIAGDLTSLMTIVSQPSDERAAPTAWYLTTSRDLRDPSKQQYFLDEYLCDGRWTLQYFGTLDAPPSVETIEDLIMRRLSGALQPASGSSFNRGLAACQFPALIAPGLTD